MMDEIRRSAQIWKPWALTLTACCVFILHLEIGRDWGYLVQFTRKVRLLQPGSVELSAVALHLWQLVVFFGVVFSCVTVGQELRKRLAIDFGDSWQNIAQGAGLGLASLLLTLFGMVAVGLSYTWAAWILWGCSLTVSFALRRSQSLLLPRLKAPEISWTGLAAGALCIVFFVYMVMEAFTPPRFHDEIAYHLYVAQQYIANNSLAFIDTLGPYSAFPQYAELGYCYGLLLGGDANLPHLINLGYTGLVCLAACALAMRLGLRQCYHPLLILTIVSVPEVALWAPVCKNDLLMTGFQVLALHAFLSWGREQDNRFLLVAGLFSGMALGVKYSSWMLQLGLIGLTLWVGFRRYSLSFRSLKPVMIFGLASLAAFSPWLARNVLTVGNPIYPLAAELLGGGGLYPMTDLQRVSFYEFIYQISNKSLWSLSSSEYGAHPFLRMYLSVSPWVFMLGVPFVLFYGRRTSQRIPLFASVAVMAVAVCVLWITTQQFFLRYIFFVLIGLLVLSALAVNTLAESRPFGRRPGLVRLAAFLVAAWLFAATAGYMLGPHGEAVKSFFTSTDKKDYLRERVYSGAASSWMNDNLPPGARVLSHVNNFYYAQQEMVYFHPQTAYGGWGELANAQEFLKRLRELKISHIAFVDQPSRQSPAFEAGRGLASLGFWRRTHDFVTQLREQGALMTIYEDGEVAVLKVMGSSALNNY